ncbi:uncharacterized protein PSANT_07086 [Moesziomyces antarcticus]|uniref:Uncharacterized protein n=1 Tax=Pseudozyma antarctica TaxID=84753 RepID=A0A5C3FYH9_PSEA2|nr:uncharacterized protein PSANT_07086 [Moesziomyces antarcticus]
MARLRWRSANGLTDASPAQKGFGRFLAASFFGKELETGILVPSRHSIRAIRQAKRLKNQTSPRRTSSQIGPREEGVSATCSQILQCALGLSYDELGGHASWFCKAALMEIALRHRSTVSGSIDQGSKRDAARTEGVEPGNATIEHQLLADIVRHILNASRRRFQRHVHLGKERGGGGGGGRSSNARPFRWILNLHQEFTCVLALNLQPAICLRALEGTRNYVSRSLVGSRRTNPPTFEECGLEALGRCRFSKLRSAPGMLVRPQVRKKDRPIYESTAASQIPGLAVSVHDIVSEDCRRQANRRGRTLDGQWQHALYSKLQRNGSGWVSLVRAPYHEPA